MLLWAAGFVSPEAPVGALAPSPPGPTMSRSLELASACAVGVGVGAAVALYLRQQSKAAEEPATPRERLRRISKENLRTDGYKWRRPSLVPDNVINPELAPHHDASGLGVKPPAEVCHSVLSPWALVRHAHTSSPLMRHQEGGRGAGACHAGP